MRASPLPRILQELGLIFDRHPDPRSEEAQDLTMGVERHGRGEDRARLEVTIDQAVEEFPVCVLNSTSAS